MVSPGMVAQLISSTIIIEPLNNRGLIFCKTSLVGSYKFKSKSVLQEWCQNKGYDLPVYKITEVSKKNGDPKRFYCEILIKGSKESSAFGKSHKQAEKNAAGILIEKFVTTGKI